MNLHDGDPRPSSQAYWDRRFTGDWDGLGGREQSRVFMDLLLRYLPAVVTEEIAAENLSILDCGCAKGDGTAVLAAEFPGSAVAGCDFSSAAVAAARTAYPHLDFFVADLTTLERGADVLISSHCFEHLDRPLAALAHLASRAARHLILLVPFHEPYPVHPEHRLVVHAGTFPERVAGWQMTGRIPLPPVPPAWTAEQLLLLYQPEEAAARTAAAFPALPSPADAEPRLLLRSLATSAAALAETHRQRAAQEEAAAERSRLAGELAEVRTRLAIAEAEARAGQAESRRCAEDARRAEEDARRSAEETRRFEEEARRTAEEARRFEGEARGYEAEVRRLSAELAAAEALRRESEAAGEARIRELGHEIAQGHLYVESLKAGHAQTVAAVRQEIVEITARTAQAEEKSAELVRWQTSRLWRLADLYWRARRWGRADGRDGPRAAEAPAAEAPKALVAPAGEVPTAPPDPAPGTGPGWRAPSPRSPLGFPELPAGRADVVVFSIIDWDFRFQRPQQLAVQLGRHGHRVFFLSTTEFLPPTGPAWELVWKAQGVAELKIRSRRALDVYRGWLEAEDLAVLDEALAALQEELVLGDVVSLVQIPFWAPLAERRRQRCGWRVVYDCMDEWANFPGHGPAVLSLEQPLVAQADLTVATARRLYEKLDGCCRRLALVPNGVDLEHYRRHYGDNALLAGVDHPIIGYYGAIASWVDLALLAALAHRFPAATLVFAGGVFHDVDLSAIEALPNVRLLGQRPYAEMPQLLWHFDLCIIPFLVNEITEATNPVKFYEYLFSGKPVVAPRLTELLPFADLCYLADGQDDFLAQVERALAEPVDAPVRQRRRQVAAANDWRERHLALWEATAATFPLISVLVITHGGLPLTRACLESLLRRETWPRFEVVVVDNGSPDATPAFLRALAAVDPRLSLVLLDDNRGFAAANNLGLAHSRGEVVVLLNNDTVVPPGLLGRLAGHLERDPDLGLVCATTNFCGNEARVEPGYSDLADLPAFAAARARAHAGRHFDLPVAALYCVAARRAVLAEVGPLDERFGIGMFEDDDYSLRMRDAGYRVVCAEDAYVHHVGQGTFRALPTAEYHALWEENRAAYEAKWGLPWTPHRPRPGVAPVASRIGAGEAGP
jgi:GT2 family glycosyltransferase/glycosyltransferase involved in cell wall biosynthesis/SAM-dependent methyltransferase